MQGNSSGVPSPAPCDVLGNHSMCGEWTHDPVKGWEAVAGWEEGEWGSELQVGCSCGGSMAFTRDHAINFLFSFFLVNASSS